VRFGAQVVTDERNSEAATEESPMQMTYRAIGVVHSPFTRPEGMPIQPTSDSSTAGVIEVFPEHVEGLQDLGGFSHVIVLYHMHEVRESSLRVIPFLEEREVGIFATRAPTRPNPIGLSIVELARIEGGLVHVANLDILDGTPVLDLKPYVPDFDRPLHARGGWVEEARRKVRSTKSDGRFG
jgi:tRNA-Thr(GGU) m(6)t(6)A37 methyltransferase TsaA